LNRTLLLIPCVWLLIVPSVLIAGDADVADAVAQAQLNDAAEGAIRAQAARFSAAYVAGDTEALVQIYAEDGVAGPGGSDFVRGRPALRILWTRGADTQVLRHRLRPVEIVVDGDHAYDWGYYEGTTGSPAEPKAFNGKYLVVWQRDADGQWRMAHDVWNSMPSE